MLPKRIVCGKFEGAVKRGRDGKKKEWVGCVDSDVRVFAIADDWKATAFEGRGLEQDVRGRGTEVYGRVEEGGRRRR